MALLLMDGFDGIPTGYSTTSYLAQNFTVVGSNYGNASGYTDGKSLRIDYPGKYATSQISKAIPSGTDFILGFRFKGPLSHEYPAPKINLGSLFTLDLRHRFFVSGQGYKSSLGIYYNGTVRAYTSEIVDYTTWRHVELKVINGVAATLYIDNAQVAVWNTPSLSNASTFSITFYTETYNNSYHDWYFDDLYLMNTTGSFANNLLGSSAKIKIKPVTTMGSANEFTNYSGGSLVNSIATVDGNHASSAVTNAKLLGTIDEITDVQILGVRTLSYTQNSDSPTKNAQDIISIDGNLTTKGSAYTPAVGTYGLNMREQFVDPADSSQFTSERLSELQFGVQVK